jgi:hypothetical protein
VARDLLGSPRSFLFTYYSIESEHVMESIIDSESTSHVSEEAPIDSFVQLPQTESDRHQSDGRCGSKFLLA